MNISDSFDIYFEYFGPVWDRKGQINLEKEIFCS